MDCPEIAELARLVEEQEGTAELREHVAGCDACQEAITSLEEEILSLQIPLSEIWFREHISCPHADVLDSWQSGKLAKDAREYVSFHVEELGCPYCQSRLEQVALESSAEGRERLQRSRDRVGEATSVLLDQARKA